MSKGVTEISRKGTVSGLTSLSGHYELNKLSEDVNKRLENLEDRLAVAELKLFEFERAYNNTEKCLREDISELRKGYSSSVKDLREDLNAKQRRSSRKYNSDT